MIKSLHLCLLSGGYYSKLTFLVKHFLKSNMKIKQPMKIKYFKSIKKTYTESMDVETMTGQI